MFDTDFHYHLSSTGYCNVFFRRNSIFSGAANLKQVEQFLNEYFLQLSYARSIHHKDQSGLTENT